MGDKAAKSARLRVLLVILVAFAAFAGFLWLRGSRSGKSTISSIEPEKPAPAGVENPSVSPAIASSPAPSSVSAAEVFSSPTASPSAERHQTASPALEGTPPSTLAAGGNFVGTLRLIIPVAGVRSDQLQDTYTDSRSGGRVHDAIDIMAPAGTPVMAAADGEIIKLFQSDRGGTTVYQLSPDKKLVFYYAHLQRYADGLTVGKFAKQGEIIAYVGDTGNAGPGNYHLHFSISVVAGPKRYWEGSNINPYPLLHK